MATEISYECETLTDRSEFPVPAEVGKRGVAWSSTLRRCIFGGMDYIVGLSG